MILQTLVIRNQNHHTFVSLVMCLLFVLCYSGIKKKHHIVKPRWTKYIYSNNFYANSVEASLILLVILALCIWKSGLLIYKQFILRNSD